MAKKRRKHRRQKKGWRLKWPSWKWVIAVTALLMVVFLFWKCHATPEGTYEKDKLWPYKDLTSGPYSKNYDGIDISRHQGRIHWDVLKANKDIGFIYIKASEGKTKADPMFKTNAKKAHEAGFQVGAYHFLHKKSTGTAQFEFFRRATAGCHMDLIPVVDVEDDGMRGMGRAAIQTILRDFLMAAKAHYGKSPMIYCNEAFYNKYLSPEFDSYYLFIASYNHKPVLKGKPHYDIWQFSERGRIRGIWNWVDLNRFAPGRSVKDLRL